MAGGEGVGQVQWDICSGNLSNNPTGTGGGQLTSYGSGGGTGRGQGGGGGGELDGDGADADAVLALGETVPGLAGEDYPILAEVKLKTFWEMI